MSFSEPHFHPVIFSNPSFPNGYLRRFQPLRITVTRCCLSTVVSRPRGARREDGVGDDGGRAGTRRVRLNTPCDQSAFDPPGHFHSHLFFLPCSHLIRSILYNYGIDLYFAIVFGVVSQACGWRWSDGTPVVLQIGIHTGTSPPSNHKHLHCCTM